MAKLNGKNLKNCIVITLDEYIETLKSELGITTDIGDYGALVYSDGKGEELSKEKVYSLIEDRYDTKIKSLHIEEAPTSKIWIEV